MKKVFVFVLLSAMALTSFAQVYAYIIDGSGTPTNVRNAPSGKVVQSLVNGESYVVELLSVNGNWWKIDPVVEIYGDTDRELTLTGSKSGYWIHNSLLQFTVAGDPTGCLRVKPSWKSKAVKMSESTEMQFRPLAISGKWVKVVTTNGRSTGWMHQSKICYNPLTTCP